MVKILNIILLLFPLLSHAGTSLLLTTNSNEIEIGKPVYVSITAKNINNNLSSINLDRLKTNFGIEVIESANKTDGNAVVQELKLELYPRQTGLITIPSLGFGNNKTSPVDITVKPASTINGVVELEATYSATSVWQRQQMLINVSVITPSKFAKIELSEFNQTGIEIYKTKPTQVELGNGQFKLTASWRLFPLLDGKQMLIPPSVNYRLSGKVQRKFFPPTMVVNIKALPSYVPPLMPVGELNVNSSVSPDFIWTVEFSSHDISPATLTSLSVPLENITNIKTGDLITTPHSENRFQHDISLLFTNSRLIKLPPVIFKTFNPVTGKIVTQHTSEINLIFISTWLKITLMLVSAFILVILISVLFRYVRKTIRHNNNMRAIIKSALDAKSPQELHNILNEYAAINQWGENLSLIQWCSIWSINRNCSAENMINKLSSACYARDFTSFSQDELNRKVYNLIKK